MDLSTVGIRVMVSNVRNIHFFGGASGGCFCCICSRSPFSKNPPPVGKTKSFCFGASGQGEIMDLFEKTLSQQSKMRKTIF